MKVHILYYIRLPYTIVSLHIDNLCNCISNIVIEVCSNIKYIAHLSQDQLGVQGLKEQIDFSTCTVFITFGNKLLFNNV